MRKTLFALVAVLAALPAFANDFTLWNQQTFSAPFTDGLVARSSEVANNNGDNAVKFVVHFDSILPKPCDCQIKAVVEEEITAGVWSVLAAQNEVISNDEIAPVRIIIVQPAFNANPGTDEFIDVEPGIRISTFDGTAPSKFRLSVYVTQFASSTPLSSVTLTVNGTTFNR